jgi:hypothetical protein
MKPQKQELIELGILPDLEESGVQKISLVENPAIEADFLYFKKEEFVEPNSGESKEEYLSRCIAYNINEGKDTDQAVAICYSVWEQNHEAFESYNDYPESARAAAKRALEWRDKNPDQDCGTAVGWARANQLAKGEMISEETIARMASFARHLQYKDVPYTQGCGGLMVDAWGGQAGIEWASNKLKEIRDKAFDIDTSGLPQYIDEVPKSRKDQVETPVPTWRFSDEFLTALEELGSQLGFSDADVDHTEQFADAQAIKNSDYTPIRKQTSADPEEFVWKFSSSRASTSGSRDFCRTMMSLNRYYSREEITMLNNLNTEFGPGGGTNYSIFMYKGGANCQHFWRKYSVKREGSRLRVSPVDIDSSFEERMAATAIRTLTGRGFLKSPQNSLPGLSGKSEFSSILKFADEEQKILVGPCMIPNIKIPRLDDNGQAYEVTFSGETIAEIAKKYMKEARTNDVNQDHKEKDAGTYVFETWLIEDPETDKANTVYGFNYPKGTWMVKMQVEDPEVWKRVKAGELKGFSVEGLFSDMEEIAAVKRYMKIKKILTA